MISVKKLEAQLNTIYQDMPYQIQRRAQVTFHFIILYVFFIAPVYILLNWPNWSYLIAHSFNAVVELIAGYYLFQKRYQLAGDLSYFLYLGNLVVVFNPMASNPESPEIIYRLAIVLILFASAIHITSFRAHQNTLHYIITTITLVIRYFVLIHNLHGTREQAQFHLMFALLLTIIATLVLSTIVNFYRELIVAIEKKDKQVLDAMTQVIQGYIPICANCKSIRDGQDHWHPIEDFITEKSKSAQFTHGMCPACIKKLYPELEPAIKLSGNN